MEKLVKFKRLPGKPIPIKMFLTSLEECKKFPVISSKVRAGIPAPSNEDNVFKRITLANLLIKNIDNTFIFEVEGDSMVPLIHEGDMLIVEKVFIGQANKKLINNRLVIAENNYEYAVKRLKIEKTNSGNFVYSLVSENEKYQPIIIKEFDQFNVWGLITRVIKFAEYL